jgi:hypothetical protein
VARNPTKVDKLKNNAHRREYYINRRHSQTGKFSSGDLPEEKLHALRASLVLLVLMLLKLSVVVSTFFKTKKLYYRGAIAFFVRTSRSDKI